jgi:hypothetical protein
MYTLEKISASPLCILCTLVPQNTRIGTDTHTRNGKVKSECLLCTGNGRRRSEERVRSDGRESTGDVASPEARSCFHRPWSEESTLWACIEAYFESWVNFLGPPLFTSQTLSFRISNRVRPWDPLS